MNPCPCGSGNSLKRCCGRYLPPSNTPAPTAEALMRSRYTAYVLGDEAYLFATWHPRTRPKTLHLSTDTQWLGLKVRNCHGGLENDQEGQVAFVARYKVSGRAARLEEHSHFEKIGERWYYVNALAGNC